MKSYSEFCDDIAKTLFDIINEKGSLLSWKKTWDVEASYKLPMGQSGYYSGSNLFKLLYKQVDSGFKSNKWLTFRQVQLQKGRVLKGAKSEAACFWRKIEKLEVNEKTKKEELNSYPLFKSYRVFNIDQTDLEINSDAEIENQSHNTSIEAMLKKHDVNISYFGNQPRYSTADDVIIMPKISEFDSENNYLATLLHELVHWSGGENRLNRETVIKYAHPIQRAKEELVAEIGSLFLSTHFGITGNIERHAAYVQGWQENLTPLDVAKCISKATQAFTWLISK